jgi:hypothetical protein
VSGRRRQFVRGQYAVAIAIPIGKQSERGRDEFGAIDLAVIIAILGIRHGAAGRRRSCIGAPSFGRTTARRRTASATARTAARTISRPTAGSTAPLTGAALRRVRLPSHLRFMAQHALHRLYRHQPVAILIHQAEAALHIGGHLVTGDAPVPIGIGSPGATFGRSRRLGQQRCRRQKCDSELDSRKTWAKMHEGS